MVKKEKSIFEHRVEWNYRTFPIQASRVERKMGNHTAIPCTPQTHLLGMCPMIIKTRRTPRILIIDTQEERISFFLEQLKPFSFHLDLVRDGDSALNTIRKTTPDLILLNLVLPYLSGFSVLREVKQNPNTHFIPVLITNHIQDIEDKIKAIELGANDFSSHPVSPLEFVTRIKSLLHMKMLHDNVDSSESILFSLAEALEAKDVYTSGHSKRVSELSVQLAYFLRLPDKEIEYIRKGGLLHDIGKIGVKEAVLLKPGRLSDDEMDNIKTHPIRGHDICAPLKSLEPCLPIIRSHHERIDGKGYPDNLCGEDIPLAARITAVADTFDAMTEDRPYRSGMSEEKALSIFAKEIESGQWEPRIVKALLEIKGYA